MITMRQRNPTMELDMMRWKGRYGSHYDSYVRLLFPDTKTKIIVMFSSFPKKRPAIKYELY